MPTKTISLKIEAYEKLKSAKRYPTESFSEVVLRAIWPEQTVTAGEFLEVCRERGPTFGEPELDRVERLKQADSPPEDKWKKP
jgi:predicted CopG family antitoxin